jgi:hypothetical protein
MFRGKTRLGMVRVSRQDEQYLSSIRADQLHPIRARLTQGIAA